MRSPLIEVAIALIDSAFIEKGVPSTLIVKYDVYSIDCGVTWDCLTYDNLMYELKTVESK